MGWRGHWDAPSVGQSLQWRIEQNKRAHQESDGVSFHTGCQSVAVSPHLTSNISRSFPAPRYEPHWRRRRLKRRAWRSGSNKFYLSQHNRPPWFSSNRLRNSSRRRGTRVWWESRQRSRWTCWTRPRRKWTSRASPRTVRWNSNLKKVPLKKSPVKLVHSFIS